MSKSPSKNKNSANSYQAQALKRLTELLSRIDECTQALSETLIKALKKNLYISMIKAGSNARLSGYDEKIYEAYAELTEFYSQIVKRFEENCDLLASPRIKNISNGIYSILKSRISQSQHDEAVYTSSNPILIEKNNIIQNSVDFLYKSCSNFENHLLEQFFTTSEHRSRFINCLENNSDIFSSFASFANDQSLADDIAKIYTSSMKFCLNSLNDIENRKVVKYYKELLDEESEILTSIIKIQVAALELEKPCSQNEQSVIEDMIWVLKEAYQHLCKRVDSISTFFREAEKKEPRPIEAEQVLKMLNNPDSYSNINDIAAINCETIKGQIRGDIHNLRKAISHELRYQFDKGLNIAKIIYEYQKVISSNIFMSDEMIEVFKNMLNFSVHSIANAQDDTSLEILKGISETMAIKIESIKENTQDFLAEGNETIEELRVNVPEVEPQLISSLVNKAFDAMLGLCTPSDEKDAIIFIKEIFTSLMKDSESTGYLNKRERYLTTYSERINKKVINFKKDCLLFEVITFEEIINYSVSRLQESNDDEILSFVDCAYEGAVMLDIILKKNNIIPVKPAPHELFNGKEHEVMMAEKNPNYKKGEIIKLVNSGYRQDGIIIVRANVIAAK